MSASKTFPIGRNAKTGRLESAKKAESHKSSSTVERMPKRGYGDTKKEPPRKK
jgi:hypothetical protein